MPHADERSSLMAGRYLSLESFRRSGVGVRTPIWFAVAPGDGARTLYVYSTADSGKAKRIRREGRVRIAACDMRGAISGAWFEARAAVVDGAEADLGMRLLDRKYWPWKQMLGLFARFSSRGRVVIAIRDVAG